MEKGGESMGKWEKFREYISEKFTEEQLVLIVTNMIVAAATIVTAASALRKMKQLQKIAAKRK